MCIIQVTVYDAKTGARVYQQRVGQGGSFTSSPVAAAGRIYISSEDGDVFLIKADASFELLAKNGVGEQVLATPAVSGDLLIIRGDRHLFALTQRPE